jgi:hypothetical protein
MDKKRTPVHHRPGPDDTDNNITHEDSSTGPPRVGGHPARRPSKPLDRHDRYEEAKWRRAYRVPFRPSYEEACAMAGVDRLSARMRRGS